MEFITLYDVTFSPSSHGEHATAFSGFGKNPSIKVIHKLAEQANFSNWKNAQIIIEEVIDAIQSFTCIADKLELVPETTHLISKQINSVYSQNKKLLQK